MNKTRGKNKMKVKIEDNLYLESDEHQYILKLYNGTFTTYNAGKENEYERENSKTLGYFSNVEQAIKKLVDMEIKNSNAENLAELLKDIKAIKKWIESKLEGY